MKPIEIFNGTDAEVRIVGKRETTIPRNEVAIFDRYSEFTRPNAAGVPHVSLQVDRKTLLYSLNHRIPDEWAHTRIRLLLHTDLLLYLLHPSRTLAESLASQPEGFPLVGISRSSNEQRPNKSLQPTPTAVMPPAAQEIMPAVGVAEH
jgi:hypothetical protein